MEWREQSTVTYQDAYLEAQRWIEAVTKKTFKGKDFRSALENGVLLCDLINRIKPGVVKKVNRLPTPIAGLDNINVFLKACFNLGLKEAQLFHPGDLQDLSSRVTVKDQETNRRLKNVLITLYWLGRRAQSECSYDGPYLNFKAFEGLLGIALHKALQELSGQKDVRDGSFGDNWYSEQPGGGGGGHRREDSLDSLDSLGSPPHSISSDATLKGSSEGCYSDAEADAAFKMADNKESVSYRRSLVLTPKVTTQFNQFLPTKDKPSGYVPAPLRKKRTDRNEDNRRSWANPVYEDEAPLTSDTRSSPDKSHSFSSAHQPWAFESGSDSDSDRPDPDLVLDDLASRRFHTPSPVPPANFAVPISPKGAGKGLPGGPWAKASVSLSVVSQQNVACLSSGGPGEGPRVERHPVVSTDSLFRELYGDSEDEDDEVGYADPVQDDLYARKMGARPQVAGGCAPYHKFLPKLWTPEDDIHIQKIKLGSQRRPWYKQMQGFSHEKSGSSSDDSSPFFSCTPTHKTAVVVHGKSPSMHPHSPPPLPKTTQLETPPLVFPPVDPTAGPRLVKCQKWPLFGRQDPREPPDPIDYESIIPDLENDDMFVRRTLAFQSNKELATVKTPLFARRRLWTSEEQLNIITQRYITNMQEEEFPDIEQDDVVQRKEKIQQTQQRRPLSGAPDNFSPMSIPEPWDLPADLKTRLLCPPCPLTQQASKHKSITKETRPESDDMLVRKLTACSQQSSANQTSPSVPISCNDSDLQKWQAIRKASQLRHKKRLMVEMLFDRSSDSFDGSKSTSDIPEEPLVTRRPHYEELEKYREQVKQSEDKWQDDLSKWKNRRKSVNSDIVKKKEEREKVEQITYGSNRRSKTFKEMQEDRDNRRNSSIGSRIRTLSFDDDQDVFEKPTPRSREILSRSYTIDTPFQSSNSVAPSQKEDNHPASSQTRVRSTKQESDTVDAPAGTTSRSAFHRPKPSGAVSSMRSSVFENTSTVKTEETSSIVSASRAPQKVPAPRSPVNVQPPSFGSTYKQPQPSAMKANPPAVSRVSASLPRSYQRSDSARLTSVVAPRPFGTQASRVGSLTRSFTLDDSNNRVNGDIAVSKNSSVPSRYRQFMTPEDEAESQSSLAHSSEDEDEQEETAGKTVTSTSSILSDQVLVKKDVPAKDSNQESSCEMRINLNQKPNSSRDFGFEAAWDSTGAHVTSVQPGSPAEIFRLQPGDEVLMVNGHRVADMSYLDWKASMDEALQEGSLVMDVRRYGQNTWDRDLPSLPFKSHKTINLTTTDHPILVGFPDASGANTLDFTSRGEISPSAKTPTHSVVDVASNGVDGGFPTVSLTTMTNDSEPLSLKNLKRRSEFFEQGGADSATPDIPVPSITQSSRSWSWDPEEERKRQEKWQKEQERLLQEKYKRGQEKLQEEWLKAQQEISFTVAQQEPVSPRSPLSYLSWEEEERKRKEEEVERQRLEEERKRREEEEKKRREEELERQIREEERKRREEELERQIREEERKRREEELERQIQEEERKRREEEVERQRLAEERKRREEELERQLREEEERRRKREEELERQRRDREEEERKRKEKESEERRQREEEELLWQRRREQEKEELRRRQAAAEEQQRQDREQRAKSFDEEEKFQRKGVSVNPGGMVHWLLEEQARSSRDRLARSQRAVAELEMERRNLLNVMRYREPERVTGGSLFDSKGPQPASQAELQRQQLLDDMRKKTPVLTDSSWIRQRAATTPGREDLPPNRRGGSLDNLDNPHNSWRSSWTPRSDSYIPNYSRHTAPSAGLTFYGGGPSGERSGSNTLPASLQGLSSGSAPWSRQSPSLSPYFLSPTTSPEPASDAGDPRQRSRSVSGKKVCTFCGTTLGKGAAMIIESLGLCYHLTCFKCFDCKSDLGGSEAGAEVRIRNKQLYCNSCYVRFKTGQPTSM
ncbi:LIM domain only protein 7 isoform X7 [Dunckerocampus dactyliophorus]|uniref:LIM domain only protein 7 isoform X7 n=1 Tax=Dunckerocampus dactyliophorus TaxID=161453 RepID=UPI0024074A52|nr:LIM domain only protein 7 isoform X7 [Dunckerocampus dactyliophorus]